MSDTFILKDGEQYSIGCDSRPNCEEFMESVKKSDLDKLVSYLDVNRDDFINTKNDSKKESYFETLITLIAEHSAMKEDLSGVKNLLVIAVCPNCDGSGTVTEADEGANTGCCGNTLSTGECCGNPIPVRVEIQELRQCQWCYEVTKYKDK